MRIANQIDGLVADYFMHAFEHCARLQVELEYMRWRLCFHDDGFVDAEKARAHCRKLQSALHMIDVAMRMWTDECREAMEDDGKIIKIDEPRRKP